MLDELKSKARRDEKLRAELLETRKNAQPLSAFCRKCRELGYEIYDMDLITAGEEFYATMRRSTNGGGENSPMLEGEDDFYELLSCLSEKDRQLFYRRYILEESTAEIAEKEGDTVQSIYSRLSRGRRRIKTELVKNGRETL